MQGEDAHLSHGIGNEKDRCILGKFCNVRGVYADLGRAHIVITLDTIEEMIMLMEIQR